MGLKEIADGKIRNIGTGNEAPSLRDQTVRVDIVNLRMLNERRDVLRRYVAAYRDILEFMASDPKALELWAVPARGAPRSLGVVSQQGATTVLRTALLKDTAAFALTVEPPGGSPSGQPTGPIVSVGKLQL